MFEMDTKKQRQHRHDNARLTESRNGRSEQLLVVPTELLTNREWLAGKLFSGSERQRPGWNIGINIRLVSLYTTTAHKHTHGAHLHAITITHPHTITTTHPHTITITRPSSHPHYHAPSLSHTLTPSLSRTLTITHPHIPHLHTLTLTMHTHSHPSRTPSHTLTMHTHSEHKMLCQHTAQFAASALASMTSFLIVTHSVWIRISKCPNMVSRGIYLYSTCATMYPLTVTTYPQTTTTYPLLRPRTPYCDHVPPICDHVPPTVTMYPPPPTVTMHPQNVTRYPPTVTI